MSNVIIAASALPSYADDARRTIANGLDHSDPADEKGGSPLRPELLSQLGWTVRTIPSGIGAAVGTAVDAGATAMLLDPNAHALPIALDAFNREIAAGTEYDSVTPNPSAAEKQIHAMLSVYRAQVATRIEPLYVQKEFKTNLGQLPDKNGIPVAFQLVGHPDVISTALVCHDLKTGARSWSAAAQLGAYALLAKANGIELTGLEVDFIPRVALTDRNGKPKCQPGAEVMKYDLEACRAYAVSILRQIKHDVVEFLNTNDPGVFRANPLSQMCANKFCAGKTTEWCKVWRK